MSATLELENENRRRKLREELTLEKQEDGTILVTAIEDENKGYGYRDDSLFSMVEYTLSKEQIKEVIEFLTACLEE